MVPSIDAVAGQAVLQVGGAQDAAGAVVAVGGAELHVVDQLALVPDVVAGGDDVGAEVEEVFGEWRRDAEAAGGVFAVDDGEVDLVAFAHVRRGVRGRCCVRRCRRRRRRRGSSKQLSERELARLRVKAAVCCSAGLWSLSLSLRAHEGEEDDVADGLGAGEEHGEAVDADAFAAGGGQAVGQGADVVFVHLVGFVVAGCALVELVFGSAFPARRDR